MLCKYTFWAYYGIYSPKCIFEGQMKTKYIVGTIYISILYMMMFTTFFFVKLHTILLNISIQENVGNWK